MDALLHNNKLLSILDKGLHNKPNKRYIKLQKKINYCIYQETPLIVTSNYIET